MQKITGLFKFVCCVAIVLGITYYTGFLKGFTPQDFQEAFQSLTNTTQVSGKKSSRTYSVIPANVIKGGAYSPVMSSILNSSTKTILYIYDESNKDFHYQLQNYIAKSPMKTSYNVYAYPYADFKQAVCYSYLPSKVCNSFDECKQQRDKAANYSAASDFFEKCSKNMCVINGRKKQYVSLKRQDYSEAVKLLNSLRNW